MKRRWVRMQDHFHEKVMCFTGHRPTQLGGYRGPEAERIQNNLFGHLARVVERAARAGFVTFISGGAQGTDQIGAEAVINRRKNPEFAHIKLVVARPYPTQFKVWPDYARERFFAIIREADVVVDVSPDPHANWKLQVRNQWMVNYSELVVGVWNGSKGGTWNCLQYAKKKRKNVLLINPMTLVEKYCPEGKEMRLYG
jgi:uncharacterized phage-like protein YoqJ